VKDPQAMMENQIAIAGTWLNGSSANLYIDL